MRIDSCRLGSSILRHFRRIGLFQKEGIAEECRRLRVGEYGQLTGQGWRVKNVTLLHQTNKFVVYLAVTNAVGDVIHSRTQHALGVFQQNDMRRSAISILVRFVNDGLIDLRAHFLACAKEIIDTHFYDVGLVANQFVDALSRLFGSLDGDGAGNDRGILDQAGYIQTRCSPGRSVPALFSQGKFLVTTQAEDGRDAIAQIDPELSRVIDMSVRADQPGNDRLSRWRRSVPLRPES